MTPEDYAARRKAVEDAVAAATPHGEVPPMLSDDMRQVVYAVNDGTRAILAVTQTLLLLADLLAPQKRGQFRDFTEDDPNG